jgi:hypothetical protein
MPDFKVKWLDHDKDPFDDSPADTIKNKIYTAANADEAMNLWEKEYPESAKFGADDCIETINHPLLASLLTIDMPDGYTYGIPIEIIVRKHASLNVKSQDESEIVSAMREITIPKFSNGHKSIHEWARTNMTWNEVLENAVILKRNKVDFDMEGTWVNEEAKVGIY